MTKKFNIDGWVVFEPDAYRLSYDKGDLKLSQKESAVLQALCENHGRVVERKTLLLNIWDERESSDISLNKNILLLRRKFESIGLNNAIETIPRVGYIFKLTADFIDQASAISIDNMIPEKVKGNSKFELIETPLITSDKSIPLTALTTLTILTVLFFISYYIVHAYLEDKEPESNTLQMIYEHQSNTPTRKLFYNDENSDDQVYDSFLKNISANKSFFAFISKHALSYIELTSQGGVLWQKVFLFNSTTDISKQSACIANHINRYKPNTRLDDGISGMVLARLKFYHLCENDNAILIGSLSVKTISSPSTIYNKVFIQDFDFLNGDNQKLFNFRRITRVKGQELPGTDSEHDDYNAKLQLKSLTIDHVNQGALQKEPDTMRIFEEFTQDEIYHTTIDDSNNIYVTSLFGGVIYHIKKFTGDVISNNE